MPPRPQSTTCPNLGSYFAPMNSSVPRIIFCTITAVASGICIMRSNSALSTSFERMFSATPPTSLLCTGPTTFATTGKPVFSAKASTSSFLSLTNSGTVGMPAAESSSCTIEGETHPLSPPCEGGALLPCKPVFSAKEVSPPLPAGRGWGWVWRLSIIRLIFGTSTPLITTFCSAGAGVFIICVRAVASVTSSLKFTWPRFRNSCTSGPAVLTLGRTGKMGLLHSRIFLSSTSYTSKIFTKPGVPKMTMMASMSSAFSQ